MRQQALTQNVKTESQSIDWIERLP